jgi:hypothetical protein
MTSGVLKMLECRANISPALIAARTGAAAGNQTTDRLGDVNKAAPDAEMIHFGDSFDIASGFDAKLHDKWTTAIGRKLTIATLQYCLFE